MAKTMKSYHDMVREEAKKIFDSCVSKFQKDSAEHGGKSDRPNFSLWLNRTGVLAKHIEKLAKKWTRKDVLWINENSRHSINYGDPRDSAFGALYKDILSELKKLLKSGQTR